MPRVRLTFWWNGHQPGDLVEVDEQTAVGMLGVIAEHADDVEEGAEESAEAAGRRPEPSA